MTGTEHHIPAPVVRRLHRYLIRARELKNAGESWVSSARLSDALGLTTSTIRQDISHLDMSGVSKRGYRIEDLEGALREVLHSDTVHRSVIVGAGLLGCALALHGELTESAFDVCALFDKQPKIIGKRVGNLTVRPMKDLKRLVASCKIDIGIIAVPAQAAQEVADHLVAAGIKGLLNLAYAHVQVPPSVVVGEARMLARLQEIAYEIRLRDNRNANA